MKAEEKAESGRWASIQVSKLFRFFFRFRSLGSGFSSGFFPLFTGSLAFLNSDNFKISAPFKMLGIVPAVALLLGTWAVVPESPRWLIASDRQEEALQVLRTIRASESRARAELEEVQLAVLEDRKLHRDVQSVRQLLAER